MTTPSVGPSEVDVSQLTWAQALEKHEAARRKAETREPRKARKPSPRTLPNPDREAELARTAEAAEVIKGANIDRTGELTWLGDEPFTLEGMTHSDAAIANYALGRALPGMRYAADARSWLLRRSDRWELVGPDYAVTLLSRLRTLAPRGDAKAEKGTQAAREHAIFQRLSSTSGIRGIAGYMSALASSPHSYAYTRLSDLDTEPHILWAKGHPWDLRTGAVAADMHRDTPHLHTAAVTPALGPITRWGQLVNLVWPDDEIREWALNVLAISVTGYPDAALPILYGPEGRGKSSVVSLLTEVMGTYADTVSAKLLSGGEGHEVIFFDLKGLRLAFVDEGPRNSHTGVETLKQITGGTKLRGRRMRENPITFNPTHTLVLTCNEPPVLTDAALRRRVKLIPCESPNPQAITRVRRTIGHDTAAWVAAEGPAVLADMMLRAKAWLNDRSIVDKVPAAAAELVEELAAEQDPIRQWIAEATEDDPSGTQMAGELYRHFVAWCKDRGVRNVPSSTSWGLQLNRLGHARIKRGGVVYRPLKPRGHITLAMGARHLESVPS